MKALDRHGRRSENGCACICIHRRAGRPLQQIILEQVKSQLPDLLKAAEDILDQLTAGKTVQSVPPALNVIFRPSAQPYLISWLRYDPVKEIAKLHIPILIVQGTTDIQGVCEIRRRSKAPTRAGTLLLIDGMNHLLKTVPNEQDKQDSSYSDPTLPVAPRLISGISSFVIKAKQQRPSVEFWRNGRYCEGNDVRPNCEPSANS